jgi:hypothetical protein
VLTNLRRRAAPAREVAREKEEAAV